MPEYTVGQHVRDQITNRIGTIVDLLPPGNAGWIEWDDGSTSYTLLVGLHPEHTEEGERA